MKDKLNREIKKGDYIAYVTSRGGDITIGIVRGFKDEVSRFNGSIIKKVHVQGLNNLVSGNTYPERVIVLNKELLANLEMGQHGQYEKEIRRHNPLA